MSITSPDKNLSEAREKTKAGIVRGEGGRTKLRREEEPLLSNQVYLRVFIYGCFEITRKEKKRKEKVLIGHRRKSGSFDLIHCTKKK